MNYRDLDPVVQMMVQEALLEYFYQTFELDERNDFYSKSGMRYGYVTVNKKTREVLVCDATPDNGDNLITIIRF